MKLHWYLTAGLTACATETEPKPAAWEPVAEGYEQIVPSDRIPSSVELMPSVNNLDIVDHEGALYLAIRTAPDHFAGTETLMHVLRSEDGGESFALEHTEDQDRDLREPRFLSWDGQLILHYAVLGTDPLSFDPGVPGRLIRTESGVWSPADPVFEAAGSVGAESFIPWRTRPLGERAMMVGYTGGGGIYEYSGEASLDVQWLGSQDGIHWEPWSGTDPVVHRGGVSETDLVVLADGTVVAVGRNEAGDEDGWGGKVCTAPPGSPMTWTCTPDPRRPDSPLLFTHENEVWLVARRNLNDQDGAFDLGYRDLDPVVQALQYAVDYWDWPKRCALWKIDVEAQRMDFVLDLVGRGDTCFPSLRWTGEHELEIWTYSSPEDGPDLTWFEGQNGETRVYRQRLRFVPTAE